MIEVPEEPGRFARHAPAVRYCDPCDELLQEAERERAEGNERERRIRRSRMPSELRGHTFDEMYVSGGRAEAIKAAREWAAVENPGGLCLFGSVGCGKTRLAATAAWARLDHYPIRWTTVPVLLARLLGVLDDSSKADMTRLITGRFPLALDDLDKTNASEWARAQLFAAIDERVNAAAPLLITTNLPPDEMEDKLGDPITSRVVGYCRVLKLPGPDYRVESKAAAANEQAVA